MSIAFENKIIDEFGSVDKENIHAILSDCRIFVCGGQVDCTAPIAPSFRDRLLRFTASESSHNNIHYAIVLAESFKDYFKENHYSDLLQFEDDIAAISSLIVIFLESPGSLVELGMFTSRSAYYKKLLIIAPQHETEAEDSFIFLGPLEHIRRKENQSVLIYPWPSDKVNAFDTSHLKDLANSIQLKLAGIPERSKFSEENHGHLAMIICEIIRLTFPVLLGEIHLALEALEIACSDSEISRYLYILQKMQFIKKYTYSSYSFYYPLETQKEKAHFGRTKDGRLFDSRATIIRMRQLLATTSDIASERRKTALKYILQHISNR